LLPLEFLEALKLKIGDYVVVKLSLEEQGKIVITPVPKEEAEK